MVLGGLWHGAGWNFVIWGALHGIYLVIDHAWTSLRARIGWRGGGAGAWVLTFGAVCIAWVFFRAPDPATALAILRGMAGLEGVALPDAIGMRLGALRGMLEDVGVTWYPGGGARLIETWMWVALAAVIALAMPNTQQIMRRWEPALDASPAPARPRWLEWQPARRHALALGVLMVLSVLSLNQPSDFLYFQF